MEINTEQQFDLSNVSRDSLRLVLSTAKEELVKYIGCHEEVKRYKKFIDEEKAKKFTLKLSSVIKIIFIPGVVMVLFNLLPHLPDQVRDQVRDQVLLIDPFLIKIIFAFLFLSPFIICFVILSRLYKRDNRRFQQTVQENIKKYEIELAGLQQKEQEAINGLKAFLLIPEDYADEYALTTMLQLIDNRRADNWKEVTALYEEHLHRTKIEDAARKTAENSRLQAEYARQTRNATRSAAAGAWASAAGIFLRR